MISLNGVALTVGTSGNAIPLNQDGTFTIAWSGMSESLSWRFGTDLDGNNTVLINCTFTGNSGVSPSKFLHIDGSGKDYSDHYTELYAYIGPNKGTGSTTGTPASSLVGKEWDFFYLTSEGIPVATKGTFTAYQPTQRAVKYWNGSAWITCVLKRWNGTAWEGLNPKRWNGTAWEEVGTYV